MFGKKKESKKKDDVQSTETTAANRKKLFKSLSQSEKSMKRSTIGPQTLGKAASKAYLGNANNIEIEPFRNTLKDLKGTESNSSEEIRKKPNLTTEEKRSRRKSLLAPVQNFFHLAKDKKDFKVVKNSSHDELIPAGKEEDSPKKIKKKHSKKKDFQSTIEKDANENQTKIQKERQKKLQKELDKLEKEKSRQENSLLFTSLTQMLETGKVNATRPLPPGYRYDIVPSVRPPVIVQR